MRHVLVVLVAVLALVVLVVLALVLALPLGVWLSLVVVVGARAVLAWVQAGRNARRWGYAERDEDLYIRHGVMFRTLVVVPYGRMQYVDVHAGPFEQPFRRLSPLTPLVRGFILVVAVLASTWDDVLGGGNIGPLGWLLLTMLLG